MQVMCILSVKSNDYYTTRYQFPRAVIANYYKRRGLHNSNLLSHSAGDQKSKIRGSGLRLSEGCEGGMSLLGLYVAILSLRLYTSPSPSCVSSHPNFPCFQGHWSHCIRACSHDLILTGLPLKILSSDKVTFCATEVQDFNIQIWEGVTIQPITWLWIIMNYHTVRKRGTLLFNQPSMCL